MMTFLRYVAVQVTAYGFDIGSFLILFELLGVNALLSNAVGKCIAGAFAYYAHFQFTFRQPGDVRHRSQVLRYAGLLGLNVPLSTLILAALLHLVPSEWLAKVLADCIGVVLTYFLSKRFVFRHHYDTARSVPENGR